MEKLETYLITYFAIVVAGITLFFLHFFFAKDTYIIYMECSGIGRSQSLIYYTKVDVSKEIYEISKDTEDGCIIASITKS